MQCTQHTCWEDSSKSADDINGKVLEKLILSRPFSLFGSGRMNAPRTNKIRTRMYARDDAVVRDGRSGGGIVRR